MDRAAAEGSKGNFPLCCTPAAA
uniref:Uncharacterized protein n=1 Tax=Anguilla anguilla TaxID=7936 RepID=A0A0E9TC20_ANGAN